MKEKDDSGRSRMQMLYHVTPSENVEEILRTGLLPRIGAASRQIGEDCPRVYLFTSLFWAKEGIETWLGEVYWDKDLSVLSISATAEELGGETNGGEVLVDHAISPSVIRELYPPEKVDEALGLDGWEADSEQMETGNPKTGKCVRPGGR